MLKRVLCGVLLIIMSISSYGCVALLAGAGAGGAALWQAGKVISEETVSMVKATAATEKAFKDQKIILTGKVARSSVTQLRGKNQADSKVAVDIFDKGYENVKIEIRIGIGEETPARELLNAIKRYL